jgi:hypothetical protein
VSPAAAQRRQRAATVALAVLAGVAFVAIRIPFLSLPLERDEGEYAYVAQRILAGELPYRDAFDQKPPGVFGAYLLAFAIFGPSEEGIHAFAALWTLATALALFALMRRLAGELAAGFAVLAFAVTSTEPRLYATAANTELFMLLPMVASVWAALRAAARDGIGWWIVCGALAAGACWFKQVAVTSAAFVAGFAALDALARRPRAVSLAVRRLAALGVGAVAVSLPVVALFMARGAWDAFLDAVLLHNLGYSRAVGLPSAVSQALVALRRQAPSFALAWVLALAALALPAAGPARIRLFLGSWCLACLVGVSIGFYFRPHYFVQVLPALAGLVALPLAAAARVLLARPAPWLAWGGTAALASLTVVPHLLANRSVLAAGSPVARSRALYGYNPFPEASRIADHIRLSSGEQETVFVLGSEPEILFHAERRSATRYIFVYPLTGAFPDALERQREAVEELRRLRPRYVVWVNIQASLLGSEGTAPYLYQETAALLRGGYRLELLAEPASPDDLFDFVYGDDARARLKTLREEEPDRAWVAVYRRAS